MSGALVLDRAERAVSGADTWRASTDAASMCKEVVNKRAIDLQGRRYVPVEGWQAIAIAHGCVASSENVRRVDGGFSAEGVIRRMEDGHEIARAEGFVGEDEITWFGGKNKWGKILPKRPDFAIRAMAQTRGISRACRSAFAHVVVLMDIGLETTPYEEMAGVFNIQDDAKQENNKPEPAHKKPEVKVSNPPMDYKKFVSDRLRSCTDSRSVDAEWNLWRSEVKKCADQGSPIPEETQSAVQDIIVAKRAEFDRQATEAPIEEPVA
ncbi:phage recombination protein Bet [Acetobacter orientalis]|uniref:Phage recombination protein Bet n=1 Tax=Acetobacter orientalis TaxID=146474 RepID=A0A2Z5ZL59_9PROT|nr:phage recombination protein Bet [Acetobacter orientalis]